MKALRTAIVMVTSIGLTLVGAVSPARAGFPGTNTKIAFGTQSGAAYSEEIQVMKWDGSGVTQLTSSGGNVGPSWSADGTKIVFFHFDTTHQSIMVMSGNGGRLRTIATPGCSIGRDVTSGPSWSPDGSRIVLACGSSSGWGSSLWVINADGTGLRELTHFARSNVSAPHWSPDGTKIVFANLEFVDGMDDSTDIYVMNADGSGVTNLTNNAIAAPKGGTAGHPDWSPDGSRIVYDENLRGSPSIMVMNADGSGKTLIRNEGSYALFGPSWSPNGQRIAYISWAPLCSGCQSVGKIMTIRADGSHPLILNIFPSGIAPVSVNWRP